jgi:hypothetical protein
MGPPSAGASMPPKPRSGLQLACVCGGSLSSKNSGSNKVLAKSSALRYSNKCRWDKHIRMNPCKMKFPCFTNSCHSWTYNGTGVSGNIDENHKIGIFPDRHLTVRSGSILLASCLEWCIVYRTVSGRGDIVPRIWSWFRGKRGELSGKEPSSRTAMEIARDGILRDSTADIRHSE